MWAVATLARGEESVYQVGASEPESADFPYLMTWQASARQPQAIDAEALVKSGSCCLGGVRCLQN